MIERRDFKGGCEIRSDAAGKPMIVGYAAVFNGWSQNLGGFVEQVDSRAFDKTIRETDVRAMGNHDVSWLLGRVGNGTLRLSTDSGGLHYEVDVNMSDPDGQRALAKVERGDWDGSSFSFRTIRDEWDLRAAPRERRLLEVSLRDVGPVTFPATLETTALAMGAARSIAGALGVELRDVEAALAADGLEPLFESRTNGISVPKDVEERALTVAWGPEDGFVDLLCDVSTALGWRYTAFDAALTLDRVLVRDWDEGGVFVVPIEMGADGEPVASEPTSWVPVEQGWVADDGERSAEQFRNLFSVSPPAEDGEEASAGVPTPAEVDQRLLELNGPRRYSPGVPA